MSTAYRSHRPIRTRTEVVDRRMRSSVRLVVLLALVVVAAGCQFRVATEVVVAADGSGGATLRVLVDEELAGMLADADVDLEEGLQDAADAASWTATAIAGEDGGQGVELTTTFDRPDELAGRVAALSSGLSDDDGALLRDVALQVTDDGGYAFTATAGIDPPQVVGSLPVSDDGNSGADASSGFDGDDLARALREGGEQLAGADLRVTFPTVPTAQGATVESTTAAWELPNNELVTVTATAPPPMDRTPVLIAVGGGGALLLAAFAARSVRGSRR